MEIISIGHSNFVPSNMITGIFDVESRPMRNIISTATNEKKVIKATNHKKTKSVIILNNGYIILSSISPITLANRFAGKTPASKFEDTEESKNVKIQEENDENA